MRIRRRDARTKGGAVRRALAAAPLHLGIGRTDLIDHLDERQILPHLDPLFRWRPLAYANKAARAGTPVNAPAQQIQRV